MKLTKEQAEQFADYLDGLNALGDVVDDVLVSGMEERYVMPTPEFCSSFGRSSEGGLQSDESDRHTIAPYCVVRFHPLQPPFYTHVHYYENLPNALRDNEEFGR